MTVGLLATIVFNIFVVLAIAILWIRMLRPPKEDPRLSRGLQLLQSKIAVIEDLSDRTDNQVQQLMRILDERAKLLQTKMLQAEELTVKIEHSMRKSLDVAEIFQDKIPHEEIIERNQQSKYVLAAKLAHDGLTVDEILAQVELPRSEVEFIAKVNREELTFDPSLLPEWAKPKGEHGQELEAKMVEKVFHNPKPDLSALQKVEENFKQSVRHQEEIERREAERIQKIEQNVQMIEQRIGQGVQMVGQGVQQGMQRVETQASAILKNAKDVVRKVEFPRVFVNKPRL
jgi:hypothetical protein